MIGFNSNILPKKIFANGVEVLSIHIMNILIWSNKSGAVSSCFAAGYWDDNYPWTDDEKWPN